MPHPPRAGRVARRAGGLSEPRRPSRLRALAADAGLRWLTVPAFVAAALASWWVLGPSSTRSRPAAPYTPAHGDLLSGYGGELPFEPRLSGSRSDPGGAQGPGRRGVLAFAGDGLDPRVRAEAEIERDLEEEPTVWAYAAEGVRRLLSGSTDRAVATLETTLLERPNDVRILNDLAAAYLVRAEDLGEPEDLARALSLAEKAVRLDPWAPEPSFNRALALHALYLHEASREAWTRYLELDGRSAWAEEARERLRSSFTPGRRETDPTLTETDSFGGTESEVQALLREGRRLYGREEIDAARPLFERALRRSEGPERSGALNAAYYLALCSYQEADYDVALRRLEAVTSGADEMRTDVGWTLAGRALQTTGLIHGVRGGFAEALKSYSQAADRYRRAGDSARLAGVESSLAELWDLLGNPRLAWSHRYNALADRSHLDPAGRAGILYEASAALLRQGRLAAAGHFTDALIEEARAAGVPSLTASALRQRAVISGRSGDTREALRHLNRSEEEAAHVPTRAIAEISRADTLLVRGEMLERSDPEAALRVLDETAGILLATDARELMPRLLRVRARARLRLDRLEEAAGDLADAIRAVSLQLEDTPGFLARSSFFERSARPVFDDSIGFELDHRRSPRAAFALAERALLAAMPPTRSSGGGSSVSIRSLQLGLKEDSTLLIYRALGDRLVLWRIDRDSFELHDLGWILAELRSEIRGFRERVEAGEESADLGSSLYDRLLGPAAASRPLGRKLFVVPDGPLHGLPFAALSKSRSGHFVLEDHAVSTSPSTTAVLRLSRGRIGNRPPRVLVVADPEIDGELFALERLPAARREAERIERLFPRVTVLEGREATAGRLVELLDSYEILHFGGHAVESSYSPGLSHLVLAPTPGANEAGAVFARDLGKLSFANLELVFLAACSTGQAGDGGIPSLAGFWLSAGASTVIGSHWEVEDAATLELVERFYRRLASGESSASALRSAQLELLRSGDPSLANPGTWAAFQAWESGAP